MEIDPSTPTCFFKKAVKCCSFETSILDFLFGSLADRSARHSANLEISYLAIFAFLTRKTPENTRQIRVSNKKPVPADRVYSISYLAIFEWSEISARHSDFDTHFLKINFLKKKSGSLWGY